MSHTLSFTVSNNDYEETNNVYYSSNSLSQNERKNSGYITQSDFFDILTHAYISTFGDNNTLEHPGDLYINMSHVLEIVCNTLNGLVDLEFDRPMRDVKYI